MDDKMELTRDILIPSFVLHPSYAMLHLAVIDICKLIATEQNINTIVAPIRGGLLFGVVASHMLKLPLVCANYSSKRGMGDDKNHKNTLPKVKAKSTVLIVDDIADSGHTLYEIKEHYEKKGCTVITAVFHFKQGSIITPDYFWWHIPNDSPFIDYPYELVGGDL